MFSPKKVSGLPLFADESGFWARPTLSNGKRAWRKLSATELTDAVCEWKQKSTDHAAFISGKKSTSPWETNTQTLAGLAADYLKHHCPNARGESRNEEFCWWEEYRIQWLIKHWGQRHPNEIRLKDLMPYYKWRKRLCKNGTGERMTELEWTTLSNILTYGISLGVVEFNWIGRDRPRLRSDNAGSRTSKPIRHARDVAPRNADDIHAVAASMFDSSGSEPAAWCWLFACLTGLRISELLRLRVDARDQRTPGYSDDRFLWVQRSKRSTKRTVLLHPDLEELLSEHFAWHQLYDPKNPWFFPGMKRGQPMHIVTLGHILPRVCARLNLPLFTPHGARAYFATKLRSDKLGEAEIASRIGDKTVSLIQTTYGGDPFDLPKPLTFRPDVGLPVWKRWRELGKYPQVGEKAPQSCR